VRWPRRRTPEERQERAIDRALALGSRGTIICDEAGLPPGFVPPSAALTPQPGGQIVGYEAGGNAPGTARGPDRSMNPMGGAVAGKFS
jgi:hypothetical protein